MIECPEIFSLNKLFLYLVYKIVICVPKMSERNQKFWKILYKLLIETLNKLAEILMVNVWFFSCGFEVVRW